MNYFIPFFITVLISIFLTGFFRRIGIKYKIISIPRERDVHKKPVPRIGGIGIFLSFLAVSTILFFVDKALFNFGFGDWNGFDKHLLAIWGGGSIISLAMLLDDLIGLKAWQKLIIQFLVVLVVISAGIGIDTLTNPFGGTLNLNSVYVPIFQINGITYHFSLWSDLLTLIWIVGMINIINFVDGVDGLAGGESFIAALTIFLLSVNVAVGQPATAMLSIILAGSVLGFLIWNFPPAKIFMGDSGSMFLGFMLGTLTLISGGKLATVFLVLGFPIIDGILVVAGRIRRKENPFTTPDKTHLHHRFLNAGYTPRQSVVFIYAISAAFAWVALRSSTENKLIASVLLVVIIFVLTRWLNLKIRKTSAKCL